MNYHNMRRRVWDYRGDGQVEYDYVCLKCETIVLDPQAGCQYCKGRQERDRARLSTFLAKREGVGHEPT